MVIAPPRALFINSLLFILLVVITSDRPFFDSELI